MTGQYNDYSVFFTAAFELSAAPLPSLHPPKENIDCIICFLHFILGIYVERGEYKNALPKPPRLPLLPPARYRFVLVSAGSSIE